MKYQNECYNCGNTWDDDYDDNPCPVCGEIEDVGVEVIDEETD